MTTENEGRVRRVAMPARVAALPRNPVGYPIPWFVAVQSDGSRDFRIASLDRMAEAVNRQLCWVCGQPLGSYVAFTLGPMCAVNRVSAEPPCHRDCALYSAMVCPFLSNPAMRRREIRDPQDPLIAPAGHAILRNPGVALVWVTRSYQAFQSPAGGQGWLFQIGEPTETQWFAAGQRATRAQVAEAMDAGMPALAEACQLDDDPESSLRMLNDDYQRALALLPA